MSSSEHPFLSQAAKGLFIGGEYVPALSGKVFESRNPATGELLATIAEGDAADIDRAVAAARAALDGPWGQMMPEERQKILLRLADLLEERTEVLALLDTLDMGAAIKRRRGNVGLLVSLLRYYAGLARAICGDTLQPSIPGMFAATVKEPVGVCGAIIPWNGPLWATGLKAGPVLATGCTLIIKPAEDASLSPLLFAELCMEAGVPPGVINVVPGFGPTAGAALAAHPGVDKISFTGSDTTGRKIVNAATGNLKRISLELGGKSPHIIFADADLAAAAPAAAVAAFANSGQICSAGTRLFVERSIHDDFVAEVARIAGGMKLGHGRFDETDLGPIVSARQYERVSKYIASGQSEGAEVFSGGERLSGDAFDAGYFVPPTIFTGVADDMTIAREEIFGPVLSVLAFDSIEEVIARANDTPFGLGAGVWTQNVGKAHRMGRALKSGSVWVNCYNTLDPAVPSGGYKGSGWGREYGRNHIEEHLNVKSLWIDTK